MILSFGQFVSNPTVDEIEDTDLDRVQDRGQSLCIGTKGLGKGTLDEIDACYLSICKGGRG
jgi:hypothetical protein